MDTPPLTRKRTLRDSTPLWATTPRISVVTRKRASRSKYDAVIVGAGISGALMATALMSGRRKVLIVDRRKPVKGSSMASTAMIQHEIDVPLHKLAGAIGTTKANRVWQRSAEAVSSLIQLTARLNISCQMQPKQSLYLAGDAYGSRSLQQEYLARSEARLQSTLLSKEQLKEEYNIDRTAALLSNMSASANPAQLTAGLLRQARRRGAEIVAGVEISDLRSVSDGVILSTSDGHLIVADHVVFCTGYEFLDALVHVRNEIASTWAVATMPHVKLPDWLANTLVWEGSDPYLYFRTTKDGRLIAGGEDEEGPDAFQSDALMTSKSKRIVEKVSDLLGCSIGKPQYRWAGAFGTTPTGMPSMGLVPGLANVYAVMGFGGNGITFSKIAADIVSAAIGGKQDRDADLFSFPA